ncbi:MAG: metal-dependent transcriptional regulator [Candidatus Bathyarchaeia archaeon]|nr:metal-dependent transcriptional regulator [Candidatus Jordarchaeia archaeon]
MKRYRMEDYLEAIYNLSSGEDYVSLGLIASRLNISSSSTTEMIQRLYERGLVEYVKYRGVRLSRLGLVKAIRTVRKHRLLELLFKEILELNPDDYREVICDIEHLITDDIAEKLYEKLGRPSFCPHGNPIPNITGEFPCP